MHIYLIMLIILLNFFYEEVFKCHLTTQIFYIQKASNFFTIKNEGTLSMSLLSNNILTNDK